MMGMDCVNHTQHLKVRTPDEMKAYAEGFALCYELFCRYFKQGKSAEEAVEIMEVWKNGINMATSMGENR